MELPGGGSSQERAERWAAWATDAPYLGFGLGLTFTTRPPGRARRLLRELHSDTPLGFAPTEALAIVAAKELLRAELARELRQQDELDETGDVLDVPEHLVDEELPAVERTPDRWGPPAPRISVRTLTAAPAAPPLPFAPYSTSEATR